MSKTDTFKEAALYIRVSTDKQEELSPDAQKRLLLEYAKKNEFLVTKEHIFIENGISGKNAEKRPEFQRMIAIAKTKPKPFDAILVWKFSRFARNQDESVFYKSVLRKKCDVDVVSITEPIMEGMYGRLIEMIIEWNDEFYSYNLSQEVLRGMEEKALKCGYQATPCLGYRAVGGGKPFAIVESEFKIVDFICNSYDRENLDPTTITRKVNQLGYRTKRGNEFERRVVIGILRNPFYAGIVAWNGIEFNGNHEVRFTQERFKTRVKQLDSEYKHIGRRSVPNCKHWLSGLLRCHVCGASLAYCHNSEHPEWSYFQCWKYSKGRHEGSCALNEAKAYAGIRRYFEKILNGMDFEYEYRSPAISETTNERALLMEELYKIDLREKRIKLAFENEIDTLEEYKENKQRLQKERERLKDLIESVEEKEPVTISKKDALKQIKTVYDVIKNEEIDYETKGRFMRSIISHIDYEKEKNQLLFHLSLSETL